MRTLRLLIAFALLWGSAPAVWAQLFFTPPPPQQRVAGSTPSIAFVSEATGIGVGSAASATVSKPAGGWLNGDILIGFSVYDSLANTGVVGTPSGWTVISAPANSSYGLFYRVASSEPSSYTFQPSGDAAVSEMAVILEYSGQAASSPINASSVLSGSTKTATFTPVTTTVPNAYVLALNSVLTFGGTASTTFSTPTGFTSRASIFSTPTDSFGGVSAGAGFDKLQATAGSVASQNVTITTTATAANVFWEDAYVAIAP